MVEGTFTELGAAGVISYIFGRPERDGYMQYNEDQQEHQSPETSYVEYLGTGHFIEATFENWESEFLQMAAHVILTVFLFQKGSAESKKLQGEEPVDQKPQTTTNSDSPWPVRKGGFILKMYQNSLSLALALLFVISLGLHAYGGAQETCQQNQQHAESECLSTISYISTSKFWFESFQNWQSEFLAVFTIVVLSIYLRQKGSPESKPVHAPHHQTGSE